MKNGRNKPIKIRKTWGDMDPETRIHGRGKQGKKQKYDRRNVNKTDDADI
jgi:hypothetical protein